MLVNICDPVFETNIQLDGSCISHEGYSVDNLISPDNQLRKKGFLCETFIRPPISLTVSFPLAFDIKSVVIGTRVGGQKSTGFQISSGRNDSIQKICSTVTEKETLVFHDNNSDLKSYGNNCDLCCFNISASRHIRSALKLCLRIFRTANSIPAIGKLEIWGTISLAVPEEQRQVLENQWKESKNQSTGTGIIHVTPIAAIDPTISKNISDSFTIPEDFFDSITCEVMICPMVLPCGKYVDQSTIEKCIQHDKMFGRTPSDPFTGIPFSAILKPTPVPELKGRMDAFMMKYSDNENVKHLPRVLGKHSISFYSERNVKLPKLQCSACDEDKNLYNLPCQHVQCRNCLKDLTCNVCHKSCDRSQIKKYHHRHS
ncbi:RING finger protein 37 [Adelges cooleyi]|uniref:RING finger protein 37 n=1 Tax=Adelges cooleyi TaxID=133065 RepID=UPI0021808559|nr:RING finger protein 37 [Adelges cooleyi]